MSDAPHDVNLKSLIIEMQPFSDGLKQWCRDHPEFTKALKIIYPERFITLQAVSTSYTDNSPADEVIGVYAVDYGVKSPRYKQDFVINLDKRDTDFVLYTGRPGENQGKYVKHIKEFFMTYGKNGHYADTHWPTFEQLPEELKPRAKDAMRLAIRLKELGIKKLTANEINQVYCKLTSLKDIEAHWF